VTVKPTNSNCWWFRVCWQIEESSSQSKFRDNWVSKYYSGLL